MIDNKLIIQDTGLAERIVTSAGYDSIGSSREKYLSTCDVQNDWIIILWNQWVLN